MRKYIRALEYNIEGVGKTIKSSKKRHTWIAKVDTREYRIIYTRSSMSGKNRIEVNGGLVFQDQSHFGSFNHAFELDGTQFVIKEGPETYQLIIDGRDFADIFGPDKVKSILKKCRFEEEQEVKAMGGNSDSTRLGVANSPPKQRSSLRADPESRSKSCKKVHFNLENNTFHDIQPHMNDLSNPGHPQPMPEPQAHASQLFPAIQALVEQNAIQTSPIIYSSTLIDSQLQNGGNQLQQAQGTTGSFHPKVEPNYYPNSNFISDRNSTIGASNVQKGPPLPQFQSAFGNPMQQTSTVGHASPLDVTKVPSQPQGDVGSLTNQPRQQISRHNGHLTQQQSASQNSALQPNPLLNSSLSQAGQEIGSHPRSSLGGAGGGSVLLGPGNHIPLFASQIGEQNQGFQQPPQSQAPHPGLWKPASAPLERLIDTRGSTSLMMTPPKQGSHSQTSFLSGPLPGLNSSQASNQFGQIQPPRFIPEGSLLGSQAGSAFGRTAPGQTPLSTVRLSVEPGTPVGSYILPNGSVVRTSIVPQPMASDPRLASTIQSSQKQVSQLSPSSVIQSSSFSSGFQVGKPSTQPSESGSRVVYTGPTQSYSRPQ